VDASSDRSWLLTSLIHRVITYQSIVFISGQVYSGLSRERPQPITGSESEIVLCAREATD